MTESAPMHNVIIDCDTEVAAARFLEQLNTTQGSKPDSPDCTLRQEGSNVIMSTPNRNKAVVMQMFLNKQGLSVKLVPGN